MWTKLTDQTPPSYKKLLVWVDNHGRIASYTSEHEFIYWDEDDDAKSFPSHWMEIIKPDDLTAKRVCF